VSSKIVVDDVSKKFRLQADRPTSLKEMFTRRGRDRSADEHWALRNVSLEIEEGSMFALIGHNGSGKSTLLRCIAGIYQPNGGRVQVDGRISTLLELGAGFHPDLSGRENIYMNATMLGMPKKAIDDVFDDIVAFAGTEIETFLDSPVKVYSTGMYVRLGFSVAVHVQPEILIIDEVIAVGDEQFQRRCFDHLYSLRRQGVTIVVVTHGLGLVETMCDAAAWLDHGVLQQIGPASKVAAAYLKRVNDTEAEIREETRVKVIAGDAVEDTSTGDDAIEDIVVKDVTFANAAGDTITNAVHGEEFRLQVHYETAGPVDSPVFGFAVHAMNGVHVTGTNTQISGFDTGWCDGSGTAEFIVPSMPLVPGEYEVSIAIADKHVQHMYDRRDREWRLIVRHGADLPPHGLMDLGGDWHLDDGGRR
jgi:ABC-2 type transport system ATP-binding protein/lipopolysaccharide transport system ATP-binding protein